MRKPDAAAKAEHGLRWAKAHVSVAALAAPIGAVPKPGRDGAVTRAAPDGKSITENGQATEDKRETVSKAENKPGQRERQASRGSSGRQGGKVGDAPPGSRKDVKGSAALELEVIDGSAKVSKVLGELCNPTSTPTPVLSGEV